MLKKNVFAEYCFVQQLNKVFKYKYFNCKVPFLVKIKGFYNH